jgi:hypothetical protein
MAKEYSEGTSSSNQDTVRTAKYDAETDQITFGGERYYYVNLDEITEKAGMKKPLFKHYIGEDISGGAFVTAIQLNSHPNPGMNYTGPEMDAYLADQAVIHQVVEKIAAENALRPGMRAAELERRQTTPTRPTVVR